MNINQKEGSDLAEGGLPKQAVKETTAGAVRQSASSADAAGSHLDNRHYIGHLKHQGGFVDTLRAFGPPKN